MFGWGEWHSGHVHVMGNSGKHKEKTIGTRKGSFFEGSQLQLDANILKSIDLTSLEVCTIP